MRLNPAIQSAGLPIRERREESDLDGKVGDKVEGSGDSES